MSDEDLGPDASRQPEPSTDLNASMQPEPSKDPDASTDLEASRRADASAGPSGLAAIPAAARLAASAWWHTTDWTLRTSVRAGRRLANVAVRPETAVDLAEEVREAAGGYVRELLESTESRGQANGSRSGDLTAEDWAALRAQGAALLHKSSDVHYEDDGHPAYGRILNELAPDEARILRLLLLSGPQPAVDIRTGGPLGLLRSRLIAPGLSMIGARAGLRYVERVPAYLNNLFRLGLIWFSRETLRDPLRYQVLEAQPEVIEAIHSVRHAKVVRRSIHLTPFGEGFCRVCLALDPSGIENLPEHASPEKARNPQPPAPG
jgi:hypothetical protein